MAIILQCYSRICVKNSIKLSCDSVVLRTLELILSLLCIYRVRWRKIGKRKWLVDSKILKDSEISKDNKILKDSNIFKNSKISKDNKIAKR